MSTDCLLSFSRVARKPQDMNDLVNHLATFVGLDFEDLPEESLGLQHAKM